MNMNDPTDREDCAFCPIATTYPPPSTNPPLLPINPTTPSALSTLLSAIPTTPDPSAVTPPCHLVLRSEHALAFLDIMPLARGHLLLATRHHRPTAGDMGLDEAQELGVWMPLLARALGRATGVTDFNVVQNNGVRAAQVVPHVHFHFIPRPPRVDEVTSRSWTMFGRGQRSDLDDDEAAVLAERIREELRNEIEDRARKGKL